MNKIVANYDSLHYCQCDIGRKQIEEINRTTYFLQTADVTGCNERERQKERESESGGSVATGMHAGFRHKVRFKLAITGGEKRGCWGEL